MINTGSHTINSEKYCVGKRKSNRSKNAPKKLNDMTIISIAIKEPIRFFPDKLLIITESLKLT